ncbi:glycosyltransferase involved in cell wall biosynthesis [Yoonia maricola]|uniref:Glycosyltransferase involved in cell wall biosynthesis n=1 Tax=Yoonia maricola TaxID=420999 RepID=A0A2M8WP10_9RHOB|nr:glycosyltransferase [Yoonia maricola]PJI92675.1 glycosyltransferase involved in cell wall biosynthesis [Yoonia maricola]
MTPAGLLPSDDVVHFYLPSFAGGGAERFFIRIANQIAVGGRPVTFIVNHATGPLRDLLSNSVKLHILGVSKATLAVPRLVTYMKHHKPKVLISALTRTNLAALLSARIAKVGTRVIVCERNQYSALLHELDPLRKRVMTWFVRRLYPTAHAVIGNTAEVTQDIAGVARLAPEQTGIIYNAAPDIAQIDAARNSDTTHPWLDDDQPLAVAIGRLMPQKDYATMLGAVARTKQPLRLLVLGEGPLQEELEDMARDLNIDDRVSFLGFQMDRFAYLVRANIFLLSSRTEGFPNALIEAVAAGVPAVSTDCAGGGAREIMGREFPDRIVPVADTEAMAKAIDAVLAARNSASADQDRQRIADIAARYQIGEIANAFLAKALI